MPAPAHQKQPPNCSLHSTSSQGAQTTAAQMGGRGAITPQVPDVMGTLSLRGGLAGHPGCPREPDMGQGQGGVGGVAEKGWRAPDPAARAPKGSGGCTSQGLVSVLELGSSVLPLGAAG